MNYPSPLELRVGVDVGCHNHTVAIGLSTGQVLEEFSISTSLKGRDFFSVIEKHEKIHGCPVAVAMEGYNGYARPLDTLVRKVGRGDAVSVGGTLVGRGDAGRSGGRWSVGGTLVTC